MKTYLLLNLLMLNIVLCAQSQKSEGRVGIGTTNPKATLDINGNLRIQSTEKIETNEDDTWPKILVVDKDGMVKVLELDENIDILESQSNAGYGKFIVTKGRMLTDDLRWYSVDITKNKLSKRSKYFLNTCRISNGGQFYFQLKLIYLSDNINSWGIISKDGGLDNFSDSEWVKCQWVKITE